MRTAQKYLTMMRSGPLGGGGGYAVTPSNNKVTAVGDSITLANAAGTGGKTTSGTTARYQAITRDGSAVGGYLTWACMLPKTGDTFSDGPFEWSGVHATGGLTIAQIKTTHIDGADSPLNDSPKAGTCVVLAGSNNLGTISPSGVLDSGVLATALAALGTIYDALIAGSILPVACTVPPSNTANNQPAVTALNAGIVTLAAEKNIPLVDFFTPCATGNNWTANYHQGDGIHPSVTGAVAMGQALRDVLEPLVPADRPTLVTTATETDARYEWLNGPFQRVSGTAGIPRGGAQPVEDTNPWSVTVASATFSLGARTNYNGQAARINKATDVGDTQWQSSGGAGIPPQYADGAAFAVGFVAEIASWAPSTGFQFQAWKQSDAGTSVYSLKVQTDANYTTAVAPFVWYGTNTIPASFGTNMRINFAWGLGGTRVIDAYLGQLSIIKP